MTIPQRSAAVHAGSEPPGRPISSRAASVKIHRVYAFVFEGAVLYMSDGSISLGDEKMELTKNEFRILSTLLENRGKIVSRDALMLRLWNDDCYVEENTLTVNVTRLRHRLESLGLQDIIITKPGRGYMIP